MQKSSLTSWKCFSMFTSFLAKQLYFMVLWPGCMLSDNYDSALLHTQGMYRTAVWINEELEKRQILTKTLEGEFWVCQKCMMSTC